MKILKSLPIAFKISIIKNDSLIIETTTENNPKTPLNKAIVKLWNPTIDLVY